MGRRRPGLVTGSLVVALVFGALTAGFAAPRGEATLLWALVGWLLMATVGVVAAVWMGRCHGKPGMGFVAAVAVCMLARLFLAAAGAWGATRQGMETGWPYILGLIAGYLPLQAYELHWFFVNSRS